jgi:hypothetical protein
VQLASNPLSNCILFGSATFQKFNLFGKKPTNCTFLEKRVPHNDKSVHCLAAQLLPANLIEKSRICFEKSVDCTFFEKSAIHSIPLPRKKAEFWCEKITIDKISKNKYGKYIYKNKR